MRFSLIAVSPQPMHLAGFDNIPTPLSDPDRPVGNLIEKATH